MADVEIVNFRELQNEIRKLSLEEQRGALRDALVRSGLVVVRNSQNAIKRGGKAKPLKTKLTSRTGTGRRSIRSDRPRVKRGSSLIDIGTDLKYMEFHETGGTRTKKAHSRTSKLGNAHKVRSHIIMMPKRPFLKPGLKKSNTEIGEIFFREWKRAIGA